MDGWWELEGNLFVPKEARPKLKLKLIPAPSTNANAKGIKVFKRVLRNILHMSKLSKRVKVACSACNDDAAGLHW